MSHVTLCQNPKYEELVFLYKPDSADAWIASDTTVKVYE